MLRAVRWGASLFLALTSAAWSGTGGAGEIAHGDVQFSRLPDGFDGSPDASLTGVSTGSPDTLASVGWWYRLAGATQETPIGTPTSGIYGGYESSLDWASLGGGAFSAHEASFVFDAGLAGDANDGGYVVQFLYVQNESAVSPLTITFFHYIDLDLPPTVDDDTALQVEWATAEVYDAPIIGAYWAQRPSRHQIAAPPGLTLLDLLNNTAVTQLNNGGSPMPAGNFSAANQWNLVIPPGAEAELKVVFAVNTPLRCGDALDGGVFCDGFESGDKSFWSAWSPP
jgi:hypothetical protein